MHIPAEQCIINFKIEQNILKFFSLFDFRPDLIQYDKLQKSNALYNLNNAFEVAEEKLGLTRLLDPEGQCSVEVTLSKNGSNNLHKYHHHDSATTTPKEFLKKWKKKLAKTQMSAKSWYNDKSMFKFRDV